MEISNKLVREMQIISIVYDSIIFLYQNSLLSIYNKVTQYRIKLNET